MRILVAMSGGVDSSVAAALLVDGGHEVVGATMKLWGGAGDSGCCSVADVTDARRVCDRLGIDHHVFNFTEVFNEMVVDPYVEAHRRGETPNPCVECNRHLKFDAFIARAERLGFDSVATGHHARVERDADGRSQLVRGHDRAKDQSYVLSILGSDQLDYLLLPVGTMEKSQVRAFAEQRGLITFAKPDSQDVCFIASRTKGLGRAQFLGERIDLHPARVVESASGAEHGEVAAVELVTIGQRRGLPTDSSMRPRYVIDVDVNKRVVTVGDREELMVLGLRLSNRTWVHEPRVSGTRVLAQMSAHGAARKATLDDEGLTFDEPSRKIARGQIVALYEEHCVVGSGVVC
ncbi:MAG TPA: tRNA 2-thiouridine(34) synthase MnmA [Acidimicrobiales bacterium]|nr:tRNA 2-thiouridine(34) synthase MnmA [Acidimicrobiales bacterium]